MKKADALFLPSVHEAAPMVIEEAKALGVPVITTRTISAAEMVLDNMEGFICENSSEGIYLILRELLDCPEKLSCCREFMAARAYGNEKALEEFDKLIG